MKAMMMTIAMMMTAGLAHADGFKCTTEDGELNVKIYNHTNPNDGTRNAGVMVLSSPIVGEGNKTIATFEADAGVLSSKELAYVAKVDLRFANSSRKGENILGTKLGQLATIKAVLYFSYSAPLRDGDEVRGVIVATKRNGERGTSKLECTRYLKN